MITINIIGTQYNLARKALEIYKAGCSGPHCNNCHNPESWDFDQGESWEVCGDRILTKIRRFSSLIDRVEFYGGEPLDSNLDELRDILESIKKLDKEIWVFTRYPLSEIDTRVKNLCDYIKCGRYIEGLKCTDNIQYGITLATSNQNVYKKGKDF